MNTRPALDESGFTLIEALIALVISGILASALVSLLIGQSRFYERTDDQMYAEQSLRASMDLVATELRMGSPSDLVSAEADSVTIRFDVIRGIVCDTTGADAVTAFSFERITDAKGLQLAQQIRPYRGQLVMSPIADERDEPFLAELLGPFASLLGEAVRVHEEKISRVQSVAQELELVGRHDVERWVAPLELRGTPVPGEYDRRDVSSVRVGDHAALDERMVADVALGSDTSALHDMSEGPDTSSRPDVHGVHQRSLVDKDGRIEVLVHGQHRLSASTTASC